VGREIRRVPPKWDHPQDYRGNFFPMFDEDYDEASARWKRDYAQFYATGQDKKEKCEFWDWDGGPPDKKMYRTYSKAEATWYQIYETVSEGTPVTPPCETKEELVTYLTKHGDYWDQKRRLSEDSGMPCAPWSEKAARNFVFGHGHMPSMVVMGGEILSGSELAEKMP
jgi:hypothetical protein